MIQRSESLPISLSAAAKPIAGSGTGRSADFYAGEENRLLLAVLENWLSQRKIYNPLWLVGEVGVGKTLFAELLTNLYRVEHRDSSVQMLPGSDFARAYAQAVKADAVAEFRERYESTDLLVIDNLEELSSKPAAQHELCKLVDDLLARNARLIAISRSPAEGQRQLVPLLASRLSSGLKLPVHAPDLATRREILSATARRHQVSFTPDALSLLAESLACAPPALTHAVTQLAVETQDQQGSIEVEFVRGYLSQEREGRRPSLNKITAAVARRFTLKSAELKGPGRRRTLVHARGMAMLLARQLSQLSYQKIGNHFGNRDHSTVMHACRQTEVLLLTDPPARYAYEELRKKLGG